MYDLYYDAKKNTGYQVWKESNQVYKISYIEFSDSFLTYPIYDTFEFVSKENLLTGVETIDKLQQLIKYKGKPL